MAEPPRLRVDPDERLRPAASRGRARQAARRARGAKRGLLGRAVKLGVLLGLWAVIIGGGALAYFAFTLPDTWISTAGQRGAIEFLTSGFGVGALGIRFSGARSAADLASAAIRFCGDQDISLRQR